MIFLWSLYYFNCYLQTYFEPQFTHKNHDTFLNGPIPTFLFIFILFKQHFELEHGRYTSPGFKPVSLEQALTVTTTANIL